ncbi:MAG: TldD/PmbA family protein [Candidatus Omnitrophica bacterium]|nr:TldD/PmbA family protein [Candidatus Omnitrophota bacterium]
MIGHVRLHDELSRLVKRSRADAISVCAHASTRRVQRFAYHAIHQDLLQEGLTVYVKVIAGRRVGVATTETLERSALARCLNAALEIARHAPVQKELPALPQNLAQITTATRLADGAGADAVTLLSKLKRLFQICQGAGAELAGSFVLGEDELAVVNSARVACYAASTVVGAKLVTLHRALSGYASEVHHRLDQLDLDGLLERSLKQCLHRQDPVTLPTGIYEVILEPEAVAELVMWLGYIAFGAKQFEERSSCFAGRMGERLMASEITITDDGRSPDGLPMPFDFEGVPKQRVVLIDRGTAAGLVYDATYGHRYGHPSTGHALPPDEVDGPLPLHLHLEPGLKSREELVRNCRRGLLIPRFHYVNGLLNPREALMTGLTREGAFLIEEGRVKAPIATMRFTESMLAAFSSVKGISRERQLIADPAQELGCAVMPTVHLERFTFTGRSRA